MLGCGRIYRSDLRQFRYLSDFSSGLTSPSREPGYALTPVSPPPVLAAAPTAANHSAAPPTVAKQPAAVMPLPPGASNSSSTSVADAAVLLNTANGRGQSGLADDPRGQSIRPADATSESDVVFADVGEHSCDEAHSGGKAKPATAVAATASTWPRSDSRSTVQTAVEQAASLKHR